MEKPYICSLLVKKAKRTIIPFMEENKNIANKTEIPSFVSRDGMIADKEYVTWIADVKQRFRQSQIKASIRVNTSMLEFYWSIGRDLVALRAEERWGTGVVKQFALDMRQSFPNATGFSHTNVKYMKQWYSFYYERVIKGQQVADQLAENEKSQRLVGQFENEGESQRLIGQIEMPETFGQVPWGQHIDIVSRCDSLEEALFYVKSVLENGWSRPVLNIKIDAGLFKIQGSAITNFDQTLPASQIDAAKELLKKEYDLSFITAEEVKQEKDLENALAKNITQFLLELGKGFSYVGRQMELQMPGGQNSADSSQKAIA